MNLELLHETIGGGSECANVFTPPVTQHSTPYPPHISVPGPASGLLVKWGVGAERFSRRAKREARGLEVFVAQRCSHGTFCPSSLGQLRRPHH